MFRERDGKRTDVVVLGCTHYPLLIEEIDAGGALGGHLSRPGAGHCPARRAMFSTKSPRPETKAPVPAPGTVLLTSSAGCATEALAAYAAMGFPDHEIVEMPV